jgi:hypothetical protein
MQGHLPLAMLGRVLQTKQEMQIQFNAPPITRATAFSAIDHFGSPISTFGLAQFHARSIVRNVPDAGRKGMKNR